MDKIHTENMVICKKKIGTPRAMIVVNAEFPPFKLDMGFKKWP